MLVRGLLKDDKQRLYTAFALLIFLVVMLLTGSRQARAGEAMEVKPKGSLSGQPPLTATGTPGCPPNWQIVPSPDGGPYFNLLYEVEAIAHNDIWAVGYHGPISNYQTLTMHWDGSEWSVINSPNAGTMNYLFSVSAAASNDVWAVGTSRVNNRSSTVTMHWDGTAWSIVPSPNPGQIGSSLLGVDVLSSNDVWAVGAGSSGESMTIMRWDGAAWSVMPTAELGLLTSVEAVSPSDVWAVGDYYNGSTTEMRIMHWDGTAWTRAPQPPAGVASRLLDIDALSATDIWAVGVYAEAGSPYRTLTLHWDGSTWQVVASPSLSYLENNLSSVAVGSSDDVWATGFYIDPSRGTQPLTLHWEGTAWTNVPNPTLLVTGQLAGVDFSGGAVWAVGVQTGQGGGNTRTLIERYSGDCQTPLPTYTALSTSTSTPYPTNSPTPTRTATNSPTLVPPTPTATPICGLRWREFPSADAGTTGTRLFTVSARTANDIWAVGVSNTTTGSYHTLIEHWNGSSWSIVPSPNPGEYNYLTGVAAIAANNAWAAGYTCTSGTCQTLLLRWNGSAWNRVSSPNVPGMSNYIYDMVALSSSNIWAVGHSRPAGEGLKQTLILRWNGSSWSIVPSPNQAGYNSYVTTIDSVSTGDIWAAGYYDSGNLSPSSTLTMRWNGTVWSIVPSPNATGAYYNQINGLGALSANDVWAVGYSTNVNTEVTIPLTLHWDGVQWAVVPGASLTTENHYLNDISALSTDNVWAVGYTSDVGTERPVMHHWNGSNWSIQGYPYLGRDAGLGGVAAVSQTEVWAVGYSPYWDGSSYYDRSLVHRYSDPCGNGTITPTPTVPATPTPCTPNVYSDAPPGSTFYSFITCLSTRGIVSGYSDCTFRPNVQVTRGQLAKIVSNSAGFSEPVSSQTFEDVPPSHTFYEFIERLTTRGYMTGYLCGSPGEPCTTGKPYFRPFANATRGQTAKIVSNAASFTDPPGGQTFEDVPPSHTFYEFIQRLATRNVMGGYPCGGPGEPCTTGRSYFRPGNDVTRGQSSKIVANAFYPDCVTP